MEDEAPDDADDRLRELAGEVYRADPDRFVEERDRLAGEVRDAGQRQLAAAIGDLRKPTLPAWAVDQVALRDSERLERLFRLGDAARDALQGDHGAARDAMSDLRGLVAELRDRAGEHLQRIGAARDAHLDEVELTLMTAAVDPARRPDVAAGVLTRPLETSGFGAVAGLQLSGDPPAERGEPPDAEPAQDRPEEEPLEEERLEEERQQLQRRLDDVREHRDEARRQADDLRDRAEQAQDHADELRDRAEEAQRAADDLRARTEEAERAAEGPADELADVEEQLQELDDRLDRA